MGLSCGGWLDGVGGLPEEPEHRQYYEQKEELMRKLGHREAWRIWGSAITPLLAWMKHLTSEQLCKDLATGRTFYRCVKQMLNLNSFYCSDTHLCLFYDICKFPWPQEAVMGTEQQEAVPTVEWWSSRFHKSCLHMSSSWTWGWESLSSQKENSPSHGKDPETPHICSAPATNFQF